MTFPRVCKIAQVTSGHFISADDNVYEALDNHRPSRFRVTRVDEAAFQKSQNVYEPICIRPRWVDYLYIPPPHKRLPKKDCMGRVQWLNKPVRKKTSLDGGL